MPIGTVKWFNPQKGFGFIAPEDGSDDAFVHISAVEEANLSTLNEGQKVEYELAEGRNGKLAAQNLSLVEEPGA
jgi:CspA family cold shock protein